MQHAAGNMSDEDLHELECVACPRQGSCGGHVYRQHNGLCFRGNWQPCTCRFQRGRQHPMRPAMNLPIIGRLSWN